MVKNNKTTDEKSLKLLKTIEEIVYQIDKENIEASVQSTIDVFDESFPYSFTLVICSLIYSSFISQKKDENIYFQYLKLLQAKEINNNSIEIFKIFSRFLLLKHKQESYYLLEQLSEQNLIDPECLKTQDCAYFMHYKYEMNPKNFTKNLNFFTLFKESYFEAIKDNFVLHKKLIKEGVNPNEISKIIRYDDIEKLQEISSLSTFNFNQRIPPSPYERFSYVNENDVSLIDFAAFFGAIKCFKYLLMNGATKDNISKFVVAGGNMEIFHLCQQNNIPISYEQNYKEAIEFHRNDIFHYLYDNRLSDTELNQDIINLCVTFCNYDILSFIEENIKVIDDNIIYNAASLGNIFLIKHFNKLPMNILAYAAESGNLEFIKEYTQRRISINKNNVLTLYNSMFQINLRNSISFFETPLIVASKYNYIEIVEYLLQQRQIDINSKDICSIFLELFLLI